MDSLVIKDKFGKYIADNKNISLDDYLLQIESDDENESVTDRLKQHPIKLMLRAIGSPKIILNKSKRLVITLFNTFYYEKTIAAFTGNWFY